MKVVYFDCFAGASGDMILGALVDAGVDAEALRVRLASVPLAGYQLAAEAASWGTLAGTRVSVAVDAAEETTERSLGDILDIIAASPLSSRVRGQAADIFRRLATAEAKVHGVPAEELHFHEVGATDALVDVLGAVIALELLGVEAVFSSPLPLGEGRVETTHGVLPVPAPATLELLAMAGASLHPAPDTPGEVLTPTAAAIITTLARFERPEMVLERVGCGVGRRQFEVPNVLRVWVGETAQPATHDYLLLETNIDDMNPELCGYVMEQLLAQGALDVWFTPIQMKKNRPAVMLSVIAPAALEGLLVGTILRETSTLGLRVHLVHRHEAERQVMEVDTSLGRVRVKLKRLEGALVSAAPEYDDCRRVALERGLSLQEVYRIVASEASAALGSQQER